jgi:hypothetical protein
MSSSLVSVTTLSRRLPGTLEKRVGQDNRSIGPQHGAAMTKRTGNARAAQGRNGSAAATRGAARDRKSLSARKLVEIVKE